MMERQREAGRLIPVKDWPKFHPWPGIGGLRHLIFHERKNGFHAAVLRCGRRVLIDEAAFFDWARDRSDSARGELQ